MIEPPAAAIEFHAVHFIAAVFFYICKVLRLPSFKSTVFAVKISNMPVLMVVINKYAVTPGAKCVQSLRITASMLCENVFAYSKTYSLDRKSVV